MTKTRQDLIARSLLKLGAIGAGQAPSAEDAADVGASLEPMMDDLAERDIYVWGDPDNIESAAFEHLAELLANTNARIFGKSPDESIRQLAERRLRLLDRQQLSGQRLKTEYF